MEDEPGAEQMSVEAVTRPSRRRRGQRPSGSTTCSFCDARGEYEGVYTGLLFCGEHLLRYYLGLHLTGQ